LAIKKDQYGKLEAEYNRAVAKIFPNTAINQGKAPAAPTEQKPPPVLPTEGNTQPAVADTSYDYTVQSVKQSGQESQLVELKNKKGEVISAYIKKGDDAVKSGTKLKDVDIVEKDSKFGKYNMINGYVIAA
jgi:hypothetical protein